VSNGQAPAKNSSIDELIERLRLLPPPLA
jgi:hypothetical protein